MRPRGSRFGDTHVSQEGEPVRSVFLGEKGPLGSGLLTMPLDCSLLDGYKVTFHVMHTVPKKQSNITARPGCGPHGDPAPHTWLPSLPTRAPWAAGPAWSPAVPRVSPGRAILPPSGLCLPEAHSQVVCSGPSFADGGVGLAACTEQAPETLRPRACSGSSTCSPVLRASLFWVLRPGGGQPNPPGTPEGLTGVPV